MRTSTRRRGATALVLCASIALCAGPARATAGPPGRAATVLDAPWRVQQLSADQRTLAVVWAPSAPCFAHLEKRFWVTARMLAVQLRFVWSGNGGDCQYMDPFWPVARIRLPVPVHGRRLLGGSQTVRPGPGAYRFTGGRPVPVAPRLIGLAPADARQGAGTSLLEAVFRRSRVRSGLRRVIAQSPEPGRPVRAGARIALTLGGR